MTTSVPASIDRDAQQDIYYLSGCTRSERPRGVCDTGTFAEWKSVSHIHDDNSYMKRTSSPR